MQFTSIISTLIFVSGSLVSAAPTARSFYPTATIKLINDSNGINSGLLITLDGVSHNIKDLYGKLPFGGAQNDFQATSVQLTGGFENKPSCSISLVAGGDLVVTINDQMWFSNFPRANTVPTVDLTAATIICKQ